MSWPTVREKFQFGLGIQKNKAETYLEQTWLNIIPNLCYTLSNAGNFCNVGKYKHCLTLDLNKSNINF